MPMTTYAANKILDHMHGKTSFTMPTQVYLALFTSSPTIAGGGTEVSATSSGYARIPITSNLTLSSGGASSNSAVVVFGPSTTSWGTITHFATFDAATGGNMLVFNALTAPKTIGAGDKAEWAVSAFSMSLA